MGGPVRKMEWGAKDSRVLYQRTSYVRTSTPVQGYQTGAWKAGDSGRGPVFHNIVGPTGLPYQRGSYIGTFRARMGQPRRPDSFLLLLHPETHFRSIRSNASSTAVLARTCIRGARVTRPVHSLNRSNSQSALDRRKPIQLSSTTVVGLMAQVAILLGQTADPALPAARNLILLPSRRISRRGRASHHCLPLP